MSKNYLVKFFTIITITTAAVLIRQHLVAGHQTNDYFTINFKDVTGLQLGRKVLVSGMQVGKIESLQLKDNGSVLVGVSLWHPVTLYNDYRIKICSSSLLAGKHINIEMGNKQTGKLLNWHTPLHGDYQHSVYEDPQVKNQFTAISTSVKRIRNSNGTFKLLTQDDKLYQNLRGTYKDFKNIGEQLTTGSGTIGRLSSEKSIRSSIDSVSDNFQTITEKIQKQQGTLGKLFHDPEIREQITAVIAGAKQIKENIDELQKQLSTGSIGKINNSETIARNLQKIGKDFRAISTGIDKITLAIKEAKGPLGVLLQDDIARRNIDAITDDLEEIVDRYQRGEGNLARLINDKQLQKKIQRVMNSFSGGVSEQVPIGSFTGVILRPQGLAASLGDGVLGGFLD